jgi:hypothetical protein
MSKYPLNVPEEFYERAKKLCEEYFSASKPCVDKILLLALEEGLRIVERRAKLEILVPKEEKYDIEKFINDVKLGRKG